MSNNFSNNNLHSLKSSNIDWSLIQNDMKLKLGKDIEGAPTKLEVTVKMS